MTPVEALSKSSRERILRRIGDALPGLAQDPAVSYGGIARLYRRAGSLSPAECLELFIDRLLDYDAEIVEVDDEGGIAEAVASALHTAGEHSLLAAEGFPAAWLPASIEIVYDTQLTTEQLEAQSTVITTCRATVAATGTIFLVHEGLEGRRSITLLPDHHLCLVRRDQIFESVGEALAFVAPHSGKPITTISGPSATSDIEMTRIRGVHGPRRLTVIFYGSERKASAEGVTTTSYEPEPTR